MVNRNKAKGTSFETLVVNYLRSFFPYAQRSHTSPTGDCGDVTGVDGLVVQCKNQARDCLSLWITDMLKQRTCAVARFGIVVHKRKGFAAAADQYVTMPLWMFCELYSEHLHAQEQ